MKMLIDSKLILFGGKGGVGKTSCAAATALYAAAQGKRTLVMSTDPAHSLSDSFCLEIGNSVTKIKKNLDGLEIDAAVLLQDYKDKYGGLIKQIADEGTFFSKDDIQQFFDLSLPGMDELMALLKMIDILAEEKYDLLILDTAPTGHTIRLLELPEVMTAYVKVLAEMRRKHYVIVTMMTRRKYIKDKADEFIDKMHHDIERLKVVLKDSSTQFVPVLIPESMALAETDRLLLALNKHGLAVQEIIVNQVVQDNCHFCQSRVIGQKKYLTEINKKYSQYNVQEIPLFATEIKGNVLEILAKILFHEKYELPQAKNNGLRKLSFDKLQFKNSIKFLLFGGKGGVGKTSCAAATALRESRKKKVLIFSTDPAHSLGDSFGSKLGEKITKINKNLDGLEIDSYALLRDFKKKYTKEIHNFFGSVFKPTTTATIDAPYDRKVMEDLFDLCPPGIDEIMALKTMMDLMDEKKYDLFILDTAPTGHTIRLLEMPEVAEEWVSTLLNIQAQYPISFEIGETLQQMLDTIKKVRSILADAAKSEFIVVSIPEAMSVLETTDLVSGLKKLRVAVNYLVINRIIPASKCVFCSTKKSEQIGYITQLQALKLQTVGVELFSEEIQGQAALLKLSEKLFQ
jgi:arsenite/tail-anchored protein-transporting ATPase